MSASATVLYRQDLDGMGCATPGCEHDRHEDGLFLHGRCHMTAPTWCQYLDGMLIVTCALCESVIARVKVAAR